MKKLSIAAVLLAALAIGFLVQRKIFQRASYAEYPGAASATASAVSPTTPDSSAQALTEAHPPSPFNHNRSGLRAPGKPRRAVSTNPTATRAIAARAGPHRQLLATPSSTAAPPPKPLLSPEARRYRLWDDLFRNIFADFFTAHAVDSSTQRRIIDLLIEERLSRSDLVDLAREQGLSPRDSGNLLAAQINEAKATMIAAVGREMTDALYLYRGSQAYEPHAAEFANRCVQQGVAVTPDIVEWTGRTGKMYQVTASRWAPDTAVRLQTTLNEVAIRRAAAKLTPAQLAVFKQLLTDQLNRLAQQSPPGS